ncbi:MAG: hypothetical protein EOM40_08875 [Clostridia bacterium]|nr:hypothetical protein [Clostridia bacterium]
MKARRSLLFGLGILLTLSMTVPAAASVDGGAGQSITVSGDEAGNTGNAGGSDSANGGDDFNADQQGAVGQAGIDGQSAGVGEPVSSDQLDNTKAAVASSEWKVDNTTVPGETHWILEVADAEAHTSRIKDAYFYELDGKTYCFDENGFLITGFFERVAPSSLENDGLDKASIMAPGLYYFAEEATNPDKKDGNPSESGLGQLQKSAWALDTRDADDQVWRWLGAEGLADNTDKDGWQNIKENWYCLDAAGKADTTKTGWQKVNDTDWYCLKADGTVDTGKNGWMQASGGVWLNAKSGKSAITAGWQQIKTGTWYYLKADGTRDTGKTGVQKIGNDTYYLDGNGTAKTGFQTISGKTYYFAKDGKRQNYTGWKTIDGKAYYFNGAYQTASTSTNGWQKIDNNWYYFEKGKTVTGWKMLGGKWYYMDPANGIMKTGFYNAGGSRYYSNGDGVMIAGGWHLIGGKWYYMQGSGAIAGGWLSTGNRWYYLGYDGVMRTGWYTVGGNKYYSDASGAMKTGWLLYGNKWYYFNGSGAMATGWAKVGNTWYYLKADGTMATGWLTLGNTKYYLYASGAMAANRWVEGYYYMTGSGAMATSSWIGQYWVGADGRWVPSYDPNFSNASWVKHGNYWYYERPDGSRLCNAWKKMGGNWFHFDVQGRMATGWNYIDGLKYYFTNDGHMLQDLDSVIGKQSSYRITVDRVRCQVMVYAKDGGNGYIIPCKTFTCSVGLPGTPTPAGNHVIYDKARWFTLMGPSYGQYVSKITSNVYFHSVAGSNMTSYNLSAGAYNMLGQPASHGCIRLSVRDAKWIYDNCPTYQSNVYVGDNLSAPFDKPATIKIPAGQNWDPTDPAV